jgi:hypothetical protein
MANPPEDFPEEFIDMMTDDVKDMMSLSLYQYMPLSRSKREIRLLKLKTFSSSETQLWHWMSFLASRISRMLTCTTSCGVEPFPFAALSSMYL